MSNTNDPAVQPDAVRELRDAGKPFLVELERICGLRQDRRQPKLEALLDALLSGEEYPDLLPWQLRVAFMMVQAALAAPHDPKPGRRTGPVTTGQRVYEAAVELAPQYVHAEIAADLRANATVLAGPLADDPAKCGGWKLGHLDRQARLAIIAQRISADADRLAAEYCLRVIGKGQGQPGWEGVANKLLSEVRELPDMPQYLRNAAHPKMVAASAKSHAVKKSKRKNRALAD